jgi:hypothetical protein
MRAGHSVLAALISISGLVAQNNANLTNPHDAVLSWYPLQVGNSWTWENEALDGDMAHPTFERWTMEATIVRVAPDAELGGTLVTRRDRVLTDVMSPGFLPANNATRNLPPESHLLISGNCVYILDAGDLGSAKTAPGYGHTRATYHNELIRGTVQPDFCFPLKVGMSWGRVPSRGLDPDFVWNVVGMNADPYGPPRRATFRLTTRAGSGMKVNRWFTEGLGVVQENGEHHGTYDELRRRLLSATIAGKTQTYNLTPARTVPLSKFDCARNKWQHFARADGTPFSDAAACIAYTDDGEPH